MTMTLTIIGSLAGLLALQTFWISRALGELGGRIGSLDSRLTARIDGLDARLTERIDRLSDGVIRDHGERIARLEGR